MPRRLKTTIAWASVLVSLTFARGAAAQTTSLGVYAPGTENQIWQQLSYVGSATCVPDPDSGACTTAPDTALGRYYFPIQIATDVLSAASGRTTGCAADNRIINYVTDQWNHRLQAFDYCGDPVAFPNSPNGWPTIGGGPPGGVTGPGSGSTGLNNPEGITVDAAHHIIVGDRDNSRIAIFNEDGSFLFEIPVPAVSQPTGVAILPGTMMDPAGAGRGWLAVVLSAYGSSRLQVYDSKGTFIGQNIEDEGSELPGALSGPGGLAVDSAGRVYVADLWNSRIAGYLVDTTAGTVTYEFQFGAPADPANLQPSDVQYPYSVAIDTLRRLIVGDTGKQRLAVYTLSFESPATIENPSIQFEFYLDARGDLNGFPRGVVQDRQGRLYVVDTANHRVQRFETPLLAIVNLTTTPGAFVPSGSQFTSPSQPASSRHGLGPDAVDHRVARLRRVRGHAGDDHGDGVVREDLGYVAFHAGDGLAGHHRYRRRRIAFRDQGDSAVPDRRRKHRRARSPAVRAAVRRQHRVLHHGVRCANDLLDVDPAERGRIDDGVVPRGRQLRQRRSRKVGVGRDRCVGADRQLHAGRRAECVRLVRRRDVDHHGQLRRLRHGLRAAVDGAGRRVADLHAGRRYLPDGERRRQGRQRVLGTFRRADRSNRTDARAGAAADRRARQVERDRADAVAGGDRRALRHPVGDDERAGRVPARHDERDDHCNRQGRKQDNCDGGRYGAQHHSAGLHRAAGADHDRDDAGCRNCGNAGRYRSRRCNRSRAGDGHAVHRRGHRVEPRQLHGDADRHRCGRQQVDGDGVRHRPRPDVADDHRLRAARDGRHRPGGEPGGGAEHDGRRERDRQRRRRRLGDTGTGRGCDARRRHVPGRVHGGRHGGQRRRLQLDANVGSVPPPTATIKLTPGILWPPNHKLAAIKATLTISDPKATVQLVSIASSEPDDGLGDGDKAIDEQTLSGTPIATAYGTDTRQFQLRAKRSGVGAGRVYTVTYRITNAAGSILVSGTVLVPHDMSDENDRAAVHDGD